MTRKELFKQVNRIHDIMDELDEGIDSLRSVAKSLTRQIEELPTEDNELEEDDDVELEEPKEKE
jgi:uncharacterized protein YoxC